LVDRVSGLENVEVLTHTGITGLEGNNGRLEALRWRGSLGEETRGSMRHLFLFIGADPNTDWLKGSGVVLDPKGFVSTGRGTDGAKRALETSVRGVFAIDDVRKGSTKRVAVAVGEGTQVAAALHAFLAEAKKRRAEALT
jgi:thioredoxin reductase (NADPH)